MRINLCKTHINPFNNLFFKGLYKLLGSYSYILLKGLKPRARQAVSFSPNCRIPANHSLAL
jgi:hypothetical protein